MLLLYGINCASGAMVSWGKLSIDGSWSSTLPAGLSFRNSGVLFVSPIFVSTTSSLTPTYSAAIRALTEFW